MNCQLLMQTDVINTFQTLQIPLELFSWCWWLEILGLRVNSGVLCPESSMKLISTLWQWSPDKLFPHHNWLTRYGLLRNRMGAEGLGEGSGEWFRIPFLRIKGIHKVNDFFVGMGHNMWPICSKLATGQLCSNCHRCGNAFDWCRFKRETKRRKWQEV